MWVLPRRSRLEHHGASSRILTLPPGAELPGWWRRQTFPPTERLAWLPVGRIALNPRHCYNLHGVVQLWIMWRLRATRIHMRCAVSLPSEEHLIGE